MNVANIKTRTEFYKFADMWYQRMYRLWEVWHNIRETKERKAHAFKLWLIAYERVTQLVQIAIKINQVKPYQHFHNGGVVYEKHYAKAH